MSRTIYLPFFRRHLEQSEYDLLVTNSLWSHDPVLFKTTDMETNLIWPGNSLPFPRFATWIKLFSTSYGTETQNGDEFCQHELFNTAVRHTDSIVCTHTITGDPVMLIKTVYLKNLVLFQSEPSALKIRKYLALDGGCKSFV